MSGYQVKARVRDKCFPRRFVYFDERSSQIRKKHTSLGFSWKIRRLLSSLHNTFAEKYSFRVTKAVCQLVFHGNLINRTLGRGTFLSAI